MKRWFRWTFFCLRGRRCAFLKADEDGLAMIAEFNAKLRMEYTCGGCGTRYASTNGLDRVRV